MYTAMGISPEVYEYGEQTLVSLKDRFDEIDKTAEYNQLKVLKNEDSLHNNRNV